MSVRDMVEALIAGERDPRVLAGLARGRLKAKRTALIPGLNGQFDEHHAELGKLTATIEELVAGLPAAAAPAGGGEGDQPALPAVERLMEVPGIAQRGAQVILAEIGLDMTCFPTAGHLVSWAKLCPRTIQSGAKLGRQERERQPIP